MSVKIDETAVRVRDTKEPDGLILTFTTDEWRAFVGGVRRGEFDLVGDGEQSG